MKYILSLFFIFSSFIQGSNFTKAMVLDSVIGDTETTAFNEVVSDTGEIPSDISLQSQDFREVLPQHLEGQQVIQDENFSQTSLLPVLPKESFIDRVKSFAKAGKARMGVGVVTFDSDGYPIIPTGAADFGLENSYMGDENLGKEWATSVAAQVKATSAVLKAALKAQLPQRPEGQLVGRCEHLTGLYLPPIPWKKVGSVVKQMGDTVGQVAKGSVHVVDGYVIPQTDDNFTLCNAPFSDAESCSTKRKLATFIDRLGDSYANMKERRNNRIKSAEERYNKQFQDSSMSAHDQVLDKDFAAVSAVELDSAKSLKNVLPVDHSICEQSREQKSYFATIYENPKTTALVAAGTLIAVYGGYKAVVYLMKQHQKKKAEKVAFQKVFTKVRFA